MTGHAREDDVLSQCQDGIDNDGDGWVDMADAECFFNGNQFDPETTELNFGFECSDGTDNDLDGLVDGFDPQCRTFRDNERVPECSDGLDNDGDGFTDAQDLSCQRGANFESAYRAECQDGIDNDQNGLIDFPADPACASTQTDLEHRVSFAPLNGGVPVDVGSLGGAPINEPVSTLAISASELWYTFQDAQGVHRLSRISPSGAWEFLSDQNVWTSDSTAAPSYWLGRHQSVEAVRWGRLSSNGRVIGVVSANYRVGASSIDTHFSNYGFQLDPPGDISFWTGGGIYERFNARALNYTWTWNPSPSFAIGAQYALRMGVTGTQPGVTGSPLRLTASLLEVNPGLEWREWGGAAWGLGSAPIPLAAPDQGTHFRPTVVALPGRNEFVFLYLSDDDGRTGPAPGALRAGHLGGSALLDWQIWSNGWAPPSRAPTNLNSAAQDDSICGIAYNDKALFVHSTGSPASLTELTYDPASESWRDIPLFEGRAPQLFASPAGRLFMVYSRGRRLSLREKIGDRWGPEELVVPYDGESVPVFAVGAYSEEPIVFATQVQNSESRLMAYTRTGVPFLTSQTPRTNITPQPELPLVPSVGALEQFYQSDVLMSVWDNDPAPDGVAGVFRRFEIGYGPALCGQISRARNGRLVCPRKDIQSVAIYPANYTPATNYDDEQARGWGGGWEYFAFPIASAVDPLTGTVYIAHRLNDGGGGNELAAAEIQLWDEAQLDLHVARSLGQYPWTQFLGNSFGYTPRIFSDFDPAPGEQRLNFPAAMVVDGARRVLYVLESGNSRVVRFGLNVTGGLLPYNRTEIGVNSGMNFPEGMDLDANGNLYVVDTGNRRIMKFSPDGTLLGSFGSDASGRPLLRNPYAISVDKVRGKIVIADNDPAQVVIFSPTGTLLGRFNALNGVRLNEVGGVLAHDNRCWIAYRTQGSASIARIQINLP